MPRLRQNAEKDAMKDFLDEVNAQCGRFGYKTQESLGSVLGICQGTAGNYLKHPETIRLGVLRSMVKVLRPDPAVMLRMLGYSNQDIKNMSRQIQ